jgi:pantetheine-phosphate adenylyltransferase
MIGLYPGSFDPITLGHEDIIERSLAICDRLIIGIAKDNFKNNFLSAEQKLILIKSIFKNNTDIEVKIYQGLTVNFAKEVNADLIIKGLRNPNDYLEESQMRQFNQALSGVDTIFFDSTDQHRSISSSLVRQVLQLNGDITKFVSQTTLKFLENL